jgi:hydroxymethylglutaryl-CoA lyase
MMQTIRLVECPRDAMQGWKQFIPTEKKIEYLQSLMNVGFDTIDFGSFVSPKAIPQMADTKEVIQSLEPGNSPTKLLAIIANVRGATEAAEYDAINYLGFPFSVSETFQLRNTNSGITRAMETVKQIQEICLAKNKQLVIYISMGFGNPYGDAYSEEIVFEWTNKMVEEGVKIISLADTVGVAEPSQVRSMVSYLVQSLPGTEIGVHLHATALGWKEKIDSAFMAGATRFDGALKGIGGCPMADDDLVGNMNTEWMLSYFDEKNIDTHINQRALEKSLEIANEIFV